MCHCISVKSQGPELARQTLFEGANLQLEQHSSFVSSQTEPLVNLQVAPLQQVLPPHPCVPPQSHSSPLSTIPLPHWLPVIVTIPRLLTKQLELTLLRPKAEQMFPTVQGENCVIPSAVLGFMMYWPLALHVDDERGQHWEVLSRPCEQVSGMQSCTAPNV